MGVVQQQQQQLHFGQSAQVFSENDYVLTTNGYIGLHESTTVTKGTDYSFQTFHRRPGLPHSFSLLPRRKKAEKGSKVRKAVRKSEPMSGCPGDYTSTVTRDLKARTGLEYM
jgi:hypothetical protein